MRTRRLIVVWVLAAVLAMPAGAQFREHAPTSHPSVRLYQATSPLASFVAKVFNPSVFQMSHGVEFSAGSFGSIGMYTNTLAWQFSDKLAMQADVAVAYAPENRAATAFGLRQSGPRVFLRNAEVAWRPSRRFQLNVQVRQNPYAFRNPYYGYGAMHPYDRYGLHHYFGDPFWF